MSRMVMEDLQILYNLHSEGNIIYLVSSGSKKDISRMFYLA